MANPMFLGPHAKLPPAVEFPQAAQAARDRQEGGSHYKDCAIQPFDFITANGLGFAEGNVVKYVTRWRKKNGVADLRKARHYLDLLIESQGEQA